MILIIDFVAAWRNNTKKVIESEMKEFTGFFRHIQNTDDKSIQRRQRLILRPWNLGLGFQNSLF